MEAIGFSDLALYIDLTSYNNGESPLKITPEFNGDTYHIIYE